MDKKMKLRVSQSRFLLGNPYAYIEHIEPVVDHQQLNQRIHENRMVMQDPYAFLDDTGGFSAETSGRAAHNATQRATNNKLGAIASKTTDSIILRRRRTKEIENLAKDLQTRLWHERGALWDGVPPTDPIELLDPEVALRLIGYEYSVEEGLGTYSVRNGNIEVAGVIDRSNKSVHVSRRFPMNVRRFTAAHELGHAVLHPTAGGVHRDRPLDGASHSRAHDEWEADKFATCFLLPEKLVKARFAAYFGTDTFKLDDNTAFALSGTSIAEIRALCPTRRVLSRMLASTERYDSRHFNSLASQFYVSVETMAIRLEELGLITSAID